MSEFDALLDDLDQFHRARTDRRMAKAFADHAARVDRDMAAIRKEIEVNAWAERLAAKGARSLAKAQTGGVQLGRIIRPAPITPEARRAAERAKVGKATQMLKALISDGKVTAHEACEFQAKIHRLEMAVR